MEAIVRNDFKQFSSDYINVELQSCALVNGNIKAYFIVNSISLDLWLYGVIYFQESKEFRMFRYRLEDIIDVDDLDE